MTKISLADGTGFVECMEVFGSDLTVVNAARVSFANESKELVERDKKLIVYLAKHGHISPFFHPQIRLRLKMPIFVAREWFRHTIGFARNEVSRRYVDFEPELFAASEWRERDTNKKQGSKTDAVECNDEIAQLVGDWNKGAINLYNTLLEKKVAPELARTILPQNMYTEFIETASLSAYARLCYLRLDPQAQAEIREYATLVSKLLEEQFPVSWAALTTPQNS